MIDRNRQIAASQAEIADLRGAIIREVVPSRRDFAQFVDTNKQSLAVVAQLDGRWCGPAGLARAQACDEAEVAALSVVVSEDALSLADLTNVAKGTSAPILRQSLLLDRTQIYASRLAGADAVVLPARELGLAGLQELVSVTRSLHMAPVIEVIDPRDAAVATAIPLVVLALRCTTDDNRLDVPRTLELASALPNSRTLLVLPEVESRADAESLLGHCDAIVLGRLLAEAAAPTAVIETFLAL